MRNLFKMVFQRVVFVSFAILIQLLFLILTVFFFDTAWRWFSTAMTILSLYYRVVVIKAPLQGLCYTVRDAVDW